MTLLKEHVRELYNTFGQRKTMGIGEPNPERPHYFLHRPFLRDQDLLIIFNTKRCRYSCHFCQLPSKSSRTLIPADAIIAQFRYVVQELKHSLSVLDRLTLSNEGSVLDSDTFPTPALLEIVGAAGEIRSLTRLVLETRLEFVDTTILAQIKHVVPRITLDILTGFETQDPHIRDDVLFKREPLDLFLRGLDQVAASSADLTAYVLFKPDPAMTDLDALGEARKTIDFLKAQCTFRGIDLTIRLNPMYMSSNSPWAYRACTHQTYQPPRLTDVMRVAAEARQEGMSVYIGLSTEGLDEPGGNYTVREDYSAALIKPIKLFNSNKLMSFEGVL